MKWHAHSSERKRTKKSSPTETNSLVCVRECVCVRAWCLCSTCERVCARAHVCMFMCVCVCVSRWVREREREREREIYTLGCEKFGVTVPFTLGVHHRLQWHVGINTETAPPPPHPTPDLSCDRIPDPIGNNGPAFAHCLRICLGVDRVMDCFQ